MTRDNRIKQLQAEIGYWWPPAIATVEYEGNCGYCEEDLLATRTGYSSMYVDHLLPKEQFPEWSASDLNYVLACSSCNSMKGAYSPLGLNEDCGDMLRKHKEVLVARVREYLRDKISARKREWQRVREIVRD